MKSYNNNRVKTTLAKNNVCYVLITCNNSDETGQMDIEMSYQGDAALASYLLQGAQSVIDQQFEDERGMIPQSKITPIS